MLGPHEQRVAEINSRLEAIRTEESSGFFGFYRWMWFGVAILLVGVFGGIALKGVATQVLLLCGGVGFVLCMTRYFLLLRRWWPVGSERSRLLQERRRLMRESGSSQHL